jgi:hypothetical protein
MFLICLDWFCRYDGANMMMLLNGGEAIERKGCVSKVSVPLRPFAPAADLFFIGPMPVGWSGRVAAARSDVFWHMHQPKLHYFAVDIPTIKADVLSAQLAGVADQDQAPLLEQTFQPESCVAAPNITAALTAAAMITDVHQLSQITPSLDQSLLDHMQQVGDRMSKRLKASAEVSSNSRTTTSLLTLDLWRIVDSDWDRTRQPNLEAVPKHLLAARFSVLRFLNQQLALILPLVDFGNTAGSWSLASRLSHLHGLIFFEIKRGPWEQILRQTKCDKRIGGMTSVMSCGSLWHAS